MENDRVVRFFIETIIDMPVENIVVSPQEHTLLKDISTASIDDKELMQEELAKIEEISKAAEISESEKMTKIAERLSVIRYDFLATVRTPEGHKEILIEIQKSKNALDLMRFRNYLGEQYKRKDKVMADGVETEEALPIITIYLLGFELPEVDAVVVHVSRIYRNVITREELDVKSDFIECLTHDSYVVQIPRIDGKNRSRLEKMLSVFEQNDFYDDKCILKNYRHEVENEEEIRLMLEILCHVGADPKKRKDIETEWRTNEFMADFLNNKKEVIMQKKIIEEKEKTIEENKKAIEEKEKTIEEKEKALEEKDKRIAELEKYLSKQQ
jgi:hypothetical protein